METTRTYEGDGELRPFGAVNVTASAVIDVVQVVDAGGTKIHEGPARWTGHLSMLNPATNLVGLEGVQLVLVLEDGLSGVVRILRVTFTHRAPGSTYDSADFVGIGVPPF